LLATVESVIRQDATHYRIDVLTELLERAVPSDRILEVEVDQMVDMRVIWQVTYTTSLAGWSALVTMR
jgi:hypothetical protein